MPERGRLMNGEAAHNGQKMADSVDDGDASSVSSYETTREMSGEDLDDEEDNTDTPLPTPHLSFTPTIPNGPPVPPKEVEAVVGGGSQVSQSTSSTTATSSSNAPTRRKSVRMSLPPTFSTTPPAIDDNEAGTVRGRSYEPWSPPLPVKGEQGGWRSKIREPVQHETWHDSSDSEDEEYRRAKRLLTRMSRK